VKKGTSINMRNLQLDELRNQSTKTVKIKAT